jgi:hypothetical protein
MEGERNLLSIPVHYLSFTPLNSKATLCTFSNVGFFFLLRVEDILINELQNNFKCNL